MKKIISSDEAISIFISSQPAQCERLRSCDIRHTCGRPRRPSINFLLVYTLEGTVLIESTLNCQNVNLYKIKIKFETGSCWVKN